MVAQNACLRFMWHNLTECATKTRVLCKTDTMILGRFIYGAHVIIADLRFFCLLNSNLSRIDLSNRIYENLWIDSQHNVNLDI